MKRWTGWLYINRMLYATITANSFIELKTQITAFTLKNPNITYSIQLNEI